MKRALQAIAFFAFLLLPSLAAAQCQTGNLAVNTVLGRLGASPGPCQAIPFATLAAQLTGSFGAVAPNLVNAGPTSGQAASPTFRALVGADLPAPGASSLGGVQSLTCSTSNWFNTLSTSGVFGCSQPNFTDLAGSIAAGQIPAGVVALTKLATQANNTVVGNVSGGVASPIALTQAQLTALINPATASLPGALPAFPNTTTSYLRGDGTYQTHNCASNTNASVYCSALQGQLPGTTTNDNASSGNIGEYISSSVTRGSPVSLTTATPANITSITITAGDWEIMASGAFTGTATATNLHVSISTTSATEATTPGNYSGYPGGNLSAADIAFGTLIQRFSVSGSTTIFMVGRADFPSGTASGWGLLQARRRR